MSAVRRRWRALGGAAAGLVGVAGCAAFGGIAESRRALEEPGRATTATTNGPNGSLLYAARTDAGVVVVDLGWSGARGALVGALERLDATPRDVAAVLLTHSHRDHVGAWPAVGHAPFWVGAGERALLLGEAAHGGWMARWADRLWRPRLPREGMLTIREIAGDTALVFGRDTVRGYALPGHTAGSVAWLVRGVLFVGDGMSHDKTDGRLRVARPSFSEDVPRARASLARVAAAVAPRDVRLVCTAHGRCASPGVAFGTALGPGGGAVSPAAPADSGR